VVQVSRMGVKFTVLVDGVATGAYATHQEAVRAAIAHREENDQ